MCGRFTLSVSIDVLTEYFNLKNSFVMKPRYNIAPSDFIPIIRKPDEIEFLRWGFLPPFTNPRMHINACAETIMEKPSFKQAFKNHRCLIIADGFYEWKTIGRIKQPYHISRQDSAPFAMAGIWEADTVAIITRAATTELSTIHDRMPVIISKNFFNSWLDPKLDVKQNIYPILDNLLLDPWKITPVSTKVNRAGFDHPECIRSLH